MPIVVALTRLWLVAEERHAEAGEPVTVSAENAALLIERGAVALQEDSHARHANRRRHRHVEREDRTERERDGLDGY